MFNRAMMLILVCYLVISSALSIANAKPSAPIDIDNVTSGIIRIGEEVRSVIRFTAKDDLQYVEVSLSPYSGIELLSHERHVKFYNLKRNDHHVIDIRIKLTNKTGYLSIFATTTNMAGNTRTRSVAIRYDSESGAMNNRQFRKNNKNTTGNRLILLPGSPR